MKTQNSRTFPGLFQDVIRFFKDLSVHNNSIYLFPDYNLKLHFLYLLNDNLQNQIICPYYYVLDSNNPSFLQSFFSLFKIPGLSSTFNKIPGLSRPGFFNLKIKYFPGFPGPVRTLIKVDNRLKIKVKN